MAYIGRASVVPFRRRGMGDAAPGYPTGGTPQDIYNAVLANTGSSAQAAKEAGDYARYMAGQWNAAPWSPAPSAPVPAASGVASLLGGNTLLYIAAALLLLAFLPRRS